MIIAPTSGQWLVITQNDHAALASELLSLWRTDDLPTHPRRRELLFAAREHDNGWREADSAPSCRRPDGRPHDFISFPRDLRGEVWRRGTARYLTREPYAAALILRHARHLHRSHRADPTWDDVFKYWQELDEELTSEHGFDVAELDLDYRWIDLTDRLSLAVCHRRTEKIEAHGFTAEAEFESEADVLEGNTLHITPFPLAGTTTLQVSCRLIPDRTYRGDADLATELALARWRHCTVQIAPSSSLVGIASDKAYNLP